MRRFSPFCLLWIALFPFALLAQSKKGYEINGHIEGLKEGEVVRMRMLFDAGIRDNGELRDSATVKDGQFHLTGFVPEGPRMYWLQFSKHTDHWCNLWIDNNQTIRITAGDIDKIPSAPIGEYVDIDGSESNKGREVLVDMERLYIQITSVIDDEIKKIKDSIGFDRSLVEGLLRAKALTDERYYQVLLSYQTSFTKSMEAFTAVDTWQNDGEGHQVFNKALYDGLDSAVKESYYGRTLRDIAALSIGQPFPQFVLPTIEGKPVALKDIIAKNKLTLVHFWASTDFGSDMSETVKSVQEELRVEYKKYHGKGLDIIGVAADSVAKEWKVRVQMEEYPWVNVSDLKGNMDGGIVNDLYHEGGHHTPNVTNVLIDTQGKIVAWDVSGGELQWYLWKYLGD